MESANSLIPRLPAPCPSSRKAFLPRAGLAFLLLSGTVAWLWGFPHWGGRLLVAFPVLATLGCATFWNWHLRAGALPKGWAAVFTVLFFVQMALFVASSQHSTSASLEAIGSGNFVYLLFWTFALQEREPGLRPLATFALMMSVGILAMPAVVIGGVLLSLLFFLDQRKSSFGFVNFFLLLFTPVILCVITLTLLNILSWGSIHEAIRVFRAHAYEGTREKFWMLPAVGPILVCGILLSRLLERKSRSCDLAFIALLFFLATAGRAHWTPNALAFFDLSIVAFAGASCFVSLSPPQTRVGRLAVLSTLSLGLGLVMSAACPR